MTAMDTGSGGGAAGGFRAAFFKRKYMRGIAMDEFFSPSAVAVIGASTKPGKIGYEVLKCLTGSSYKGGIFPINPAAAGKELLGKRCYARLSELPAKPELAVFVVGADRVPEAMEECASAGVKAVVIISGGFKELGKECAELERRTVAAARKGGIRVIGPNCIGISSAESGLETFFQPREMMARPGPGPVAMMSQSGTFGATLLEWFAGENIGVSRFVSIGNKSDVDELDFMRYCEKDNGTKLIALYAEGLPRGREFATVAAEVGRKKPILLLKGGRTSAGAHTAASHTGSVAGSFPSFAGAMAQSGVIVAQDADELLDIAKLLVMQPLPRGGRLAMATNGAGPCVVVADAVTEGTALSIAKLSEASVTKLKSALPPFCVIDNPVDLTGSADTGFFQSALEALSSDSNVDILMPVLVFQDAPLGLSSPTLPDAMGNIAKAGKTMLAIAGGGPFTLEQSRRLAAVGVPVFPTARRAVRALDAVVRYAGWLRRQASE